MTLMRLAASVFSLTLVLSSLTVVGAQEADRTKVPSKVYWPGEEWAATSPAPAGLDPEALQAIAKYVLSQNSTSFLVVRHGRIVLEAYGRGGGREVKRPIASATKSMTSVLVGMALDAGRFESLDQPVADFLPAWRDAPENAAILAQKSQQRSKARITMRHLLSMTSGLNPRGFSRRRPAGDQFTHNAEMPLVATPGTKWQYNTPAYHMLFRLLEKATGKSLADWTKQRLLDPLGMRHSSWRTRDGGAVTNYFNLECSARDMARFGLLVLRGGKWRGEQLVSAKYFKTATTPTQDSNPAYGLLFWLNVKPGHAAGGRRGGPAEYRFPGAPRDLIACLGARGQHIIVIPSQDLVVIRQGDISDDRRLAPRYVRMLLGAVEGGGFAQEPMPKLEAPAPRRAPRPGRAFGRLDTNGDGFLTKAEFAKSALARRRPELFARLDVDGDGRLSRAEAARWRRQR